MAKGKINETTSIIMIYFIVSLIIAVIFYPLIPFIMNYPPDSINNQFQKNIDSGLLYWQQYLVIVLLIFATGFVFLKLALRGVGNWATVTDEIELKAIRSKCINLPYYIYVAQILIPFVSILLMFFIIEGQINWSTIKISIIFLAFVTFSALIYQISSKRIFLKILLNTFSKSQLDGKRIKLSNKIFIQIIPMFLVAILFSSLINYSRLVKEKGDFLYLGYKSNIEQVFKGLTDVDGNKLQELSKSIKLHNKSDFIFIISSDKKIFSSSGYLSPFFIKYADEISGKYSGHVYDGYGIDSQGVIMEIGKSKWQVGIKYSIASTSTIFYLFGTIIILFFLSSFVVLYFSRSLSEDIALVTRSMEDIANGSDVNLDRQLAVTSNDEIGDLVIAFNKIQLKERENIDSIKENQTILLEQERLASLGQLIGGIAHNLKTPIMSLSGGIEALKDLVFEYRDSIDDESVTISDHKEIAKEMLSWLDKMKPYCGYMSDVISAVKGQAVQMNASTTEKFTVDELVKRVDLLMKHELKKYHCTLNIETQVDMTTEIKGEVNNLVQVFDNIIINAMQAYEGRIGVIDLRIIRSGDNVEFTFRDYAKGIPKKVADRLFKEMITTKGKNGTGLGLYMSYSTIKGRFGGNMSFASKEGTGTTFQISIPCIVYRNQEVGT